MKSLLTILLLCSTGAFAQLNVNFIMSSRPPARISEWPVKKEVITYIITNQGPVQEAKRVKIRSTLKTIDGTVIATTDLNVATVITVGVGNTVLSAGSVYPLESQVFTGKYKNTLERTGKLPSGSYQLCVQLTDAVTAAPASNEICRIFYLAGYQLPVLIKPSNEEILDLAKASTAITFRWTPVVPYPQTPVKYRLQVFEIYADQHPVQALRSNQPVLDEMITGTTQYIWQPKLGFIDNSADSLNVSATPSTHFIWTIQTLDLLSDEVFSEGSNEGRSEPYRFNVQKDAANRPPKQKIN